MAKDFEYKEVETSLPAERALDVAASIANLVPLIGSPVASILGGIPADAKSSESSRDSGVYGTAD